MDAARHQLGADPVNSATHTTGTLSLIFLMLTLAITPLRKITGWNFFSHFRRMLGLFAYFYLLVHLSLYIGFYQGFDFTRIFWDVVYRRFILFGMAAFVMLTPLAITSTNGMIKRLGAKRWKKLHELIYFAAIAGVIHYWMLVKADLSRPKAFAGVLTLLLGFRVGWYWKGKWKNRAGRRGSV